MKPKVYDRTYFDRWYGRGKGSSRSELRRKVAVVLATAELLLDRKARNALDIGCGEARWRSELERLRPGISYLGVDPSEYVVRRFGRTRNIVYGRVGQLETLGLRRQFDIVICADVLHYVGDEEVVRGLARIRRLMRGVAFMEVFAAEDEFSGDRREWRKRPAGWYRRSFAAAGLAPCGMHCWADRRLHGVLSALERCR